MLLLVLQLRKDISIFYTIRCLFAVFGYKHFLTTINHFRLLCTIYGVHILLQTAIYYLRRLYIYIYMYIYIFTYIYIYIYIYLYQGFLSRTLTTHRTAEERRGPSFIPLHSTISIRSQTLRHLFASLHLRQLSHIFNRNACVYQTAT